MALPKIQVAISTFLLPVSNQKISYRRFTVKEEKILLIAAESGTQSELLTAFEQVLNNCIISDIEINTLPMVDLELLFLLLRVDSVSNIAEIRIRDSEDGQVYDMEIDLQKLIAEVIANITVPERTIQLTEDVGVVMRHLSLENLATREILDSDSQSTNSIFEMLGLMIEKAFDADTVYPMKDFSETEVMDFLESFTPDAITKLQEYVEALPKLMYYQEYVRVDGTTGTLKLEGIADFFQYL